MESILLTLVHKLREQKAMHVQTEEERTKGAIQVGYCMLGCCSWQVGESNDNETDDGGICGCL